MVVFFDTSSLVKLYYQETDSEQLVKLVDEHISEIYLSEITKIEFVSAIWKKVRIGELIPSNAEGVLKCFENDWDSFSWIRIENRIIESAKNLFLKFGLSGLRTLDALQFAACLSEKDKIDVFLTHDDFLNGLFKNEGLKTEFA